MQCWELLVLEILHCKELWKILPSFILILLGVYLYLSWTSESLANTREVVDRSGRGCRKMQSGESCYNLISLLWLRNTVWWSIKYGRCLRHGMWMNEYKEQWQQEWQSACYFGFVLINRQASKQKAWRKYPASIVQEGYKQVDWAQNWNLIPYTFLPLAFRSNG